MRMAAHGIGIATPKRSHGLFFSVGPHLNRFMTRRTNFTNKKTAYSRSIRSNYACDTQTGESRVPKERRS